MTNIVPLRKYTMRDCSGNDTAGMSHADQIQNAWSNYYQAEIASGASRELARSRSDAFVEHRYGSLIDNIRAIMRVG